MKCVISCEHASSRLPSRFAHIIKGKEQILASHQAYDLGAALLARRLARQLGASLYLGTVSRLLVDLNRSPTNRKSLFSLYSRKLQPDERQLVLHKYYYPYRESLEKEICVLIAKDNPVLHVSIHSFSPVKRGKVRKADIGLLYDPARKWEKPICGFLAKSLQGRAPQYQVRKNYPYLGITDGFTSFLRKKYPAKLYVGLEIEINQALLLNNGKKKRGVEQALVAGIKDILKWQDFSRLKKKSD